ENALRVTALDIAMADGARGEGAVKALSDQGLVAFADGQRNKVKRLAIESARHGCGNSLHHALQLRRRQHDVAHGSVADAVGCLGYTHVANDLLRGAYRCVHSLAHGIILT